MKKRLFFTLLLLLAATTATYAYDFCVDGIYYDVYDNKAFVVNEEDNPWHGPWDGQGCYSGDVIIPETVTYEGETYTVTGISDNAFFHCTDLYSVIIPNSVRGIGDSAFMGCSGLTSINIPNSVTIIGYSAFCECTSLTNVNIPDNIRSISGSVFQGCSSLTSITIPNTVVGIGEAAFRECGLTSVTIPSSVKTIAGGAFAECYDLSDVIIPNSVSAMGNDPFEATAWYRNQPDGLVYAGLVAYNYKGTMPSGTSLVIQDGTLCISSCAFGWSEGLESVTIPNSVTTIGERAFEECDGLIRVVCLATTPPKVYGDFFDYYDFYKYDDMYDPFSSSTHSQATLYVPREALAAYQSDPFWGQFENICPVEEMEIVLATTIEVQPTLAEVVVGKTLQLTATVGPVNTTDKSVTWSTSDPSIATIYSNGLVTAVTEGTVTITATTNDGSQLSASCAVTVIPDPNIRFADPYVKQICVRYWDTDHDGGLSKAEAAAVTTLNRAFKNNQTITSFNELQYFTGLTTLNSSEFYNCQNLTSITIPTSVTAIGNNAFYHCSSLSDITIPNSVTSIGNYAFCDCYALASVIIPNSVTSIGNYAFIYCQNLTCVTIGNSVTSIGDGAFCSCIDLTSVTIPNSVTTIGERAFVYCHGLTSIMVESGNPYYDSRDNCNAIIKTATNTLLFGCMNTIIPNSVTSIGKSAFYFCYGLTSVIIPNSVTTIGESAFEYCNGLTSVTIGSSVTSIGYRAFSSCNALTDVYSHIKDLTNVSYGGDFFYLSSDIYSDRTLYVPKGTAGDYQANENWYPYFGNIVEMEPEVVPGDVDGDGVIGIGDVTGIIDLILAGNATIEDYPAADANGDDIISIADVTHLIDIILYPNN